MHIHNTLEKYQHCGHGLFQISINPNHHAQIVVELMNKNQVVIKEHDVSKTQSTS